MSDGVVCKCLSLSLIEGGGTECSEVIAETEVEVQEGQRG